MKIVLFCRYYSSQFEYMENAYVRQFCKMGHDVTVVTTTQIIPKRYESILTDDSKSEREPGSNVESGVRVIRLKGRYYGRKGGIELLPGLTSTIRSLKPDLFFFQSVENFPIALQTAILKPFFGYDYFVVVNEHYIYNLGHDISENPGLKTILLNRFARVCKWFSLRAATRILGMNEYSSDLARELYKGAEHKMIDITLGVDSETIIHKPDSRDKIRNQLNVLPEETLLVHSGKMAPYKKTHLIVEAMTRLGRNDVKLLLIGKCEAEYRKHIDALIKEGQLENQVLFVSWVAPQELHHYFSASDVAIWVDHATISTIEASAVGIPIIVPDFHGYEHRTKYENGLRILPGNVDDLTEKLGFLLENKSEALAMGMRGRELVEKELNWNSIVDKILA